MSGWPLPDDWYDHVPDRVFRRRQTSDGLHQLRRLAERTQRHDSAFAATHAALGRRVVRTRELLLCEVPTRAGRVPFVLVGPCGVFALTLAGGARNTEDDFATLDRLVDALRSSLSRVDCTVRGAVVLTGIGACHTPHYFHGAVVGSHGGFHVGADHLDSFFELFGDGVGHEDLIALRRT
jgi:hypothetical protein